MRYSILILLLASLTMVGCKKHREFNRVLKSGDRDLKFEYAVKYYEEEDYFRSIPLLENLIAVEKGTERGEDIYYYYALCQYGLGDYYLASYYFKQFSKTYAGSEHAEECAFMSAYCSYVLSPDYELDQGESLLALNGFQIFLNRYPETTRKDTVNALMDVLWDKLELKAFESARLYHQIEQYQAASVAFNNMLVDYPESSYKEEVLFLILESNYLLAENSVDAKKEERYTETIKSYHTFVAAFPESSWVRRAENIKENAEKALANLSSITNE